MTRGGFQLVELVVALAIAILVAVLATPDFLRLSAGLRVRAAASEVAAALHLARSEALRWNEHAAVRFYPGSRGDIVYGVYRDGDGDTASPGLTSRPGSIRR